MSFSTVPAATKQTLLLRSGPQILSALMYVWELARLLCCGVTSFFAFLTQSLARQAPDEFYSTPHRALDADVYRIWKPVVCPLRLTVVLDLDETLVLTCPRHKIPLSLKKSADQLKTLKLQCDTGRGHRERLIVFLRPGLKEFLNKLAAFSEVVLFSAAVGSYGNPLLDLLDPSRRVFSMRLFRESTVCTEVHKYVKDLTKLGRDLRRTVIVDNRAFSFLLQPRNGIRCKPFRGSALDRELPTVILPLLESLSHLRDVRPTLHSAFRMENWFRSKGLRI